MTIKRYEVVRDDGDDAIGWGHSYSFYQIDTTTKRITTWNRDFTAMYQDVTDTTNQWELEDIQAITKGFRGGKRRIFMVNPIPVVDITALLAYLDTNGFVVNSIMYMSNLTFHGRDSAYNVPFCLVVDIYDPRHTRVHCDNHWTARSIMKFFEGGAG